MNVDEMTRGELLARARHGMRINPTGIPVGLVRYKAKENGYDPADVIAALTTPGIALYGKIVTRDGKRWLVRAN